MRRGVHTCLVAFGELMLELHRDIIVQPLELHPLKGIEEAQIMKAQSEPSIGTVWIKVKLHEGGRAW